MSIFDYIETKGHEQIVFCSDKESGLKCIISIHNTVLGPSLGGCRMWNYKSEKDALYDVLRLSRGMTYKASVAGLNLGGGKAVIIGDPKTMKTERLFRTFGQFVESLSGRYITAEDVGTSEKEMDYVKTETNHVTGIKKNIGGSGDPSPVTAYGVYCGIKAALKKQYGSDSISDKKILVQGVGHVGSYLIELLLKENAKIIATDIDPVNIKNINTKYPEVTFIHPDDIFNDEYDLFAPCALGGIINDSTIDKIKCNIVAGSANNVLADEEKHSILLKKKNILYIPDFVISSGGLINVASEIEGYNKNKAMQQTSEIYNIVSRIINISETNNTTTLFAANKLAEDRINNMSELNKRYKSKKN